MAYARVSDRVYSQPARKAVLATMFFALAVYIAVLTLIAAVPALGLRILWFAAIPIAPMVLLVAPNVWVSVCPVSTVQTLSQRVDRRPRRRLSASATERLQVTGWVLMLVGIPTRHLVFNTVGWATFWTALAITGLALVVGLAYRSLSGWCVGACPIRPIEVLYGQFALERNRPEKCTACSACIAGCLRLRPENSHREFHRVPFIANLAMGFPGFVAAYFALDLFGLCNTEHAFFAGSTVATDWIAQAGLVYGAMFAGFAVSWSVFRFLQSRGFDGARLFRVVAISAFSAYYLGVAPEICEAWSWPMWAVPLLLTLPLATLVWATVPLRRPHAGAPTA